MKGSCRASVPATSLGLAVLLGSVGPCASLLAPGPSEARFPMISSSVALWAAGSVPSGDLSSETTVGVAETTRVFLDVAVSDRPLGRLIFRIPVPNPLPLHAENVVKLCAQARTSIDPRCTYVGCEFSYSPQYIEGMAQYRWAHVLPGKGRNAVGRADGRIEDPESLSRCAQKVFGGTYYGLRYDSLPGVSDEESDGEGAVALTVPLSGPGRGSSCLSVVRVGESPREWGERLLINGAVLGWMETGCRDALRDMARQREGPPVVIGSGVFEDPT